MGKFIVYGKDVNNVTHKREVEADTNNWALFQFLRTEEDGTQYEVLIAEKIQ